MSVGTMTADLKKMFEDTPFFKPASLEQRNARMKPMKKFNIVYRKSIALRAPSAEEAVEFLKSSGNSYDIEEVYQVSDDEKEERI